MLIRLRPPPHPPYAKYDAVSEAVLSPCRVLKLTLTEVRFKFIMFIFCYGFITCKL